jgi:hypothetical protein
MQVLHECLLKKAGRRAVGMRIKSHHPVHTTRFDDTAQLRCKWRERENSLDTVGLGKLAGEYVGTVPAASRGKADFPRASCERERVELKSNRR